MTTGSSGRAKKGNSLANKRKQGVLHKQRVDPTAASGGPTATWGFSNFCW